MKEQFYYLNREPFKDGKRYVHTYECELKPAPLFLIKLGFFKNPSQALNEAKKYFSNATLCDKCCIKTEEFLSHAFIYQQNNSQGTL